MRTEPNVRPDFDIRDHMVGPVGLLGSAANVIMQLGSPGVGYGVAESKVDSGNVMIHPLKRLRTTISYLVVALLGSDQERASFRDAVNRVHVRVRSDESSPTKYNAFDPELQLWVAACLYVGFRDIRLAFLGPMDDATADDLYHYCSRLGTTLQVSRDQWPSDRDAFEKYWQDGLSRVRYDEPVRAHLIKLLDLEMLPRIARFGTARVNTFYGLGFMPAEVRAAMGLDWTDQDQRRFDRWIAFFRFVTRLMPKWLRNANTDLQLVEVRWRMRRRKRLL